MNDTGLSYYLILLFERRFKLNIKLNAAYLIRLIIYCKSVDTFIMSKVQVLTRRLSTPLNMPTRA